jgi:hypothetical protein
MLKTCRSLLFLLFLSLFTVNYSKESDDVTDVDPSESEEESFSLEEEEEAQEEDDEERRRAVAKMRAETEVRLAKMRADADNKAQANSAHAKQA